MRGKFLTRRETEQLARSELNLAEGKLLVQLARLAATKYVETDEIVKPPHDTPEKLLRKSGVFVTLNTTKPTRELRGCIGFPYPEEPLVNATIKAAIYAATEDPRFPPVSLEELKHFVVIEVTALTEPQVLKVNDRRSLPDHVQVGRHGLIVSSGRDSGLLLPQVATEWKWDASEFLVNCCLKAGLPPDSWLLEGVEVKVFEGEIFEETEPAGEVRRKSVGEK
jgi:uncharacterized protein (TIGR00296 family)